MNEKCCCHLVLPNGTKVAIKDSVARQLVETLSKTVEGFDSSIRGQGEIISEVLQGVNECKSEQDRLDRVQVLMQESLSKKVNKIETDSAYTYVHSYDKDGDSSIRVSSGGGNNTIPLRDGSGLFYVGSENTNPTEGRHPVNKAYLDRRLSSIDVSDVATVKKLTPTVFDLNEYTGVTDGFTMRSHFETYSVSPTYPIPKGTIEEGIYIFKTTVLRDTGAVVRIDAAVAYYDPEGGFAIYYNHVIPYYLAFEWTMNGVNFRIFVDSTKDTDTYKFSSHKYKVELMRIV
jgi:hypothetical protein